MWLINVNTRLLKAVDFVVDVVYVVVAVVNVVVNIVVVTLYGVTGRILFSCDQYMLIGGS